MMEMIVLKSAAVGLIVALIVLAIGFLPERLRSRLQALVYALGFCAIYYCFLGVPPWPPSGGMESLPYAALMLAVFVLIYPMNFGMRYAIRALFVLIVGAICLWAIHDKIRGGPTGMRNVAAFFCLALGLWSIVEKAAEKMNLLSVILLPMLALMAASFLLVLEGNASLSQMAAGFGAILGFLLLLALFRSKAISRPALVPFLSVFPVMILVVAHFYGGINPWRLIILCWPFMVLWFRRGIPFVPKQPIGEALALAVLAIAPLAYWLMGIYKTSGGLP